MPTPSNPFACYDTGRCRARTASIHFNYKRPPGASTPSWYYNQLTPKETSEATFFAMSTTGYGYAGIQTVFKDDRKDKDRLVLCSIWDQSTGLAKMEKCGDDVVCEGFGGEGTGGKAKWYFDWQLGKNYAFMLHRQPASDGSGRVKHSCWFYAEELEGTHPGGWKHIATATSGMNSFGTTFADSGSFLEQWNHMHSDENRMGEFGPAYYKEETGEWYQSKRTKFSVAYLQSRLEAGTVRIDRISAGQAPSTKRLYLQTGGNAQASEPLRQPRDLDFPQAPCALPAPVYGFEAKVALTPAPYPLSTPVLIKSHRGQNLQDDNGNVKLTTNAQSWEMWTIVDDCDGKVLLRSHRGQQLQDHQGTVKTSPATEDWEEWILVSAGDGKFFIKGHFGEYLQDSYGNVGMSGNTGSWEEWSFVQP